MGILSHLFGPRPKHQPGVYIITNRATGCIYIGATSRPMIERWAEHRRKLKSGYHHNKRLQADWNTYGGHVFKFTALETTAPEDAFTREAYWQRQRYTPDGCYNPDPDAPPPCMRVSSGISKDAKLFFFKVARGALPKTKQNIRKAFEGMGIYQTEEVWEWLWQETEKERLAGRLVAHPSSIDEDVLPPPRDP